MYKYITLAALMLSSAALGFAMNRSGEDQFTIAFSENVSQFHDVVMDIDMDGYTDLIRYQRNNSTIELEARLNTGDLSFSPWESLCIFETIPDSGFPSTVDVMAAPQLNGDSAPDLIVNIRTSGKSGYQRATYYLLNNGSGAFNCSGDVTGDGATGVDDLLGVIGDWGCVGEGLPD